MLILSKQHNKWADKLYSLSVAKFIMSVVLKNKTSVEKELIDLFTWFEMDNNKIISKDNEPYKFFTGNDYNSWLNNFSKSFDLLRKVNDTLHKNFQDLRWETLFESCISYIDKELLPKISLKETKLAIGIQLIASLDKFMEKSNYKIGREKIKKILIDQKINQNPDFSKKQGGWSWAWDHIHKLLA